MMLSRGFVCDWLILLSVAWRFTIWTVFFRYTVPAHLSATRGSCILYSCVFQYLQEELTNIPHWRIATKIYLCKSASHEWISSVAFLFPPCRLPFPIFSRFPIDSVSHFLLGPLVGASVRLSLKSIFSVLWRHCSSQNARLASYIAAPAHPRY